MFAQYQTRYVMPLWLWFDVPCSGEISRSPYDQGTGQEQQGKFWIKKEHGRYTLGDRRQIRVICGAGQPVTRLQSLYSKGTHLCRGSARVYVPCCGVFPLMKSNPVIYAYDGHGVTI